MNITPEIAAVIAMAVASWIFWVGSEAARAIADTRLVKNFRPGRRDAMAEAYRHAAPMLKLSRELGTLGTLMCAATAGMLAAVLAGWGP